MVTKRQLGVFILLVGLVIGGGVFAVDWLGAGEWSGFGPLQRIGLGVGLFLLLVGVLLFRLGDRPA